MGKHKHKHKHHNQNNNNNCQKGSQCGCGQHKPNEPHVEHLHITSEAEMIKLLHLIMESGKAKSELREQKAIELSNAMLADAGVTAEDMIPPADVVAAETETDTETAI